MSRISYICRSCGETYGKWSGKCESCGDWNSLQEGEVLGKRRGVSACRGAEFVSLGELSGLGQARLCTGLEELDRVFGGGVFPASTLLIGGDPGIGKSTLMLQAASALGFSGIKVAYVSGEEAVEQIQARAVRLGLSGAPVRLLSETRIERILEALSLECPGFVVVDSVQTLHSDSLEAASGSVAQVRTCSEYLASFSRGTGCVTVLVGHVTKDGQLAGPRLLEHMVDAVFYFEGERGHQFRILRSVKNRFGPTDEIGVFEMGERGLSGVKDVSALFLESSGESSGRAVLASLEGSRPVLAEMQALAGVEVAGSARRSVVGWDGGRLSMLLAVLESRCGLAFSRRDVYLSVAGGYRVNEPAGDLAAAAALISALRGFSLPSEAVFFGEVALSGDIRPCSGQEIRLREASRLGFVQAFISASSGDIVESGIKVHRVSSLREFMGLLSKGK